MKKIFTLAFLSLGISYSAFSQTEMDAFNLSYNDLTGTARSVSMGGAFGALGGDASGVAINPAGIGVYKNSEVVTTLNFTNNKTSANFLGNKTDENKFNFIFDNLAFVGVVPLNSDEVPLINFGFAYNKLKSFNRKISANGGRMGESLTDYLANRANNQNDFNYISTANNSWDADWLSILANKSGLILKDPNGSSTFVPSSYGDKSYSNLNQREKGQISSYDFNVGTTISDILSVGVTVSVTDMDYRLYSDYKETFSDGSSFYLTNYQKTEGTGWQLKTGLILKPINELRIGVAYHSPTWYNMTDYYYADADAYGGDVTGTPDGATDYKLRTPDKWVFSLAGIIGQYAIISADYELTNYGNMHLNNRYDDFYNSYSVDNQNIKDDFKNASTLRVGAEIRFTPQFSGRVGYMWQQSPVKDKLVKGSEDGTYTAGVDGSLIPQYSIVGDANYFTWGLGYKFTPYFYTDVAFVIKSRKDDFYTFGGAEKTELKTNEFTGLLSFGYKF